MAGGGSRGVPGSGGGICPIPAGRPRRGEREEEEKRRQGGVRRRQEAGGLSDGAVTPGARGSSSAPRPRGCTRREALPEVGDAVVSQKKHPEPPA